MAYPHWRIHCSDAFPAAHRSFFLHHARSTVVRMGMALRLSTRHSVPGLRIEWRRVVMRTACSWNSHFAALAIAAPRDGTITGARSDVAGGGGCGDSSVRAPAHCKLAFFSALVSGARPVGKMGAAEST